MGIAFEQLTVFVDLMGQPRFHPLLALQAATESVETFQAHAHLALGVAWIAVRLESRHSYGLAGIAGQWRQQLGGLHVQLGPLPLAPCRGSQQPVEHDLATAHQIGQRLWIGHADRGGFAHPAVALVHIGHGPIAQPCSVIGNGLGDGACHDLTIQFGKADPLTHLGTEEGAQGDSTEGVVTGLLAVVIGVDHLRRQQGAIVIPRLSDAAVGGGDLHRQAAIGVVFDLGLPHGRALSVSLDPVEVRRIAVGCIALAH